jgi:hypothetical protein
MRPPFSLCVYVYPINFRLPEPICTKLCVYITAPIPILTVYLYIPPVSNTSSTAYQISAAKVLILLERLYRSS